MIELTERERRLAWEVVTMVDLDALRDNLERVGATGDEGENLEHALTQLQEALDPDGAFLAEWWQVQEQVQERERRG